MTGFANWRIPSKSAPDAIRTLGTLGIDFGDVGDGSSAKRAGGFEKVSVCVKVHIFGCSTTVPL